MAVDYFWKIQLGSYYLTDDGLTSGVRAICSVEGLDAFVNTDGTDPIAVQEIRALGGTVYQQQQIVVDAPITVKFPKLSTTLFNNIKTVLSTYNGTPSPFTLVFTGTPGTFAGTGKPRFAPTALQMGSTYQNQLVTEVALNLYMTLD